MHEAVPMPERNAALGASTHQKETFSCLRTPTSVACQNSRLCTNVPLLQRKIWQNARTCGTKHLTMHLANTTVATSILICTL
jgi:hypothetical protein